MTHQRLLLPLQLTTRPQRTRLHLPRVRLTQLRLATRPLTTRVALLEHQEPLRLRTTQVAVLRTALLRRTTLAVQQGQAEAQLPVGQPPTELAVELAEERLLAGLLLGRHIGLALLESLAQVTTTPP